MYKIPKKTKEVSKLKDLLVEEYAFIEVQIFEMDIFEATSGYKIITLKVTDFTDSLVVKLFTRDEIEFQRMKNLLKEGNWYSMYGSVRVDSYSNDELVFLTRLRDVNFIDSKSKLERMDKNTEKRVELHTHTKMSQMDGIVDGMELVKTAIKWGHKAIAITDHNGCQAFTNIFDEISSYKKYLVNKFQNKIDELISVKKDKVNIVDIELIEEEIKKVNTDMELVSKFKVLYGTELEMTSDNLDIVINSTDDDIFSATYVVIDIETTGLNSGLNDSMIKIDAVKMRDGSVIDIFNELINPGVVISDKVIELTGITNVMLKNSPNEEEVVKKFMEWIGDLPLVSYYAKFDINMLESAYHKYGLGLLKNTVVDIFRISQIINKDFNRHTLSFLAKKYGFVYDDFEYQIALYGAKVIGNIFFEMLKQLDKSIKTFNDLLAMPDEFEINKWNNGYHINIIAKNKIGLKNMYQLISYGATDYLENNYRVPRRLVNKLRDNLLIGSGCYNSEIFNVALSRCENDLKKAMEFYDYIEVQAPSNYIHLIESGNIYTIEEVRQVIEKIVRCAKEIGKIVVATGDVHTLNKEDKIYREILIHQNVPGKGRHPLAKYNNINDERVIPDQYFRTTDEMLEEFVFLGNDIAREIVITNTNKIADMCFEYDLFDTNRGINLPKIENSDMVITEMVYNRAFDLYGKPLPFFIEERIAYELYGNDLLIAVKREFSELVEDDKIFSRLHDIVTKGRDEVRSYIKKYSNNDLEISGIIGNSYEVIYLIAQKLVQFSNSKGFITGIRGSVGASLVATLMKITDINPLPAHYYCSHCKYSMFHDDDGKELGINYLSGFDLPIKLCSKCGEKLIKDGQNIPFEVLFGFEGNKFPYVDLNFSDLIQKSVHDFTKNLFGSDKVYRAGTIGIIGEKTAYGYVKAFCEDYGIKMRSAEIDRISKNLIGVKRITGQHPGAIIFVPFDMDITDVTPVQYPADDQTSMWKTTHLDYHAIDETLLYMALLSHADLTQLFLIKQFMGELVSDDVIFEDKELLKLFLTPDPLGVTKDEIMNETGILGISEFNNSFVRNIIDEVKPTTFSELVKISGLSHGTNVWLENADELVRKEIISFKDVIAFSDDLMLYLMDHGIKRELAYEIMEFVRKGKASKDVETWVQYVEVMKNAGIEQWFIDVCSKIKYMFLKSHSLNYVMNALRILYYKLYYPAVYYATYFSRMIDYFDYELVMRGKNAVKDKIIEELNENLEDDSFILTNKLNLLKVVLEANARGFIIGNIDLMKSDAKFFQIAEDGVTLIPPFMAIDGLGEYVAKIIQTEARLKPFISIDDFQKRCRVSTTLVEKMMKMGIFKDLP